MKDCAMRLAVIAVSMIALSGMPAFAQVSPQGAAAQPQGKADPKDSPSVEKMLEVTGFRSAHFGMTEGELRKAAAKDFGVKPEALKADDTGTERTRVLTVRVPDLLAKGGTAEVTYILGYSTKKLIQVGIVWSKDTDASMTPNMLIGNANLLSENFRSQGFQPNSIVLNALSKEGVVLFRGADAQNHIVQMTLLGQIKGKDEQQKFAPTALQLVYAADPVKPDVYRLPAGQF